MLYQNPHDPSTLFHLRILSFRYHTALSNTGVVALSTPYIDAFGAGVVITAAHTIYRGEVNSQHNPNDKVIGVLGADFPLSYFQK